MESKDQDPLDFNFLLMEMDTRESVEIIPSKLKGKDKILIPPNIFPCGIPNLENSIEEEIQKTIIEAAENLSIHSSNHINRQIPRKTNYSSLYRNEKCPLPTTIQVDRDPVTGEMIGYHEDIIDNSNITARNSCLFTRQPNTPADALRGLTTNFPFWPGGMDIPDVDKIINDGIGDDNFDDSELLTCPPGFDKGINFQTSNDLAKLDNESMPNIDELLSQFDIEDVDDIPEEEDDNEEIETNLSQDEHEFESSMESLFPKSEVMEKPSSTTTQQVTNVVEEWAVKVDVSTSVADFHQQVPDMAHKWPFELDIFQKQAVLHLEKHESVFVAAHTSAGKTVVAEYAIALSAKHMTRVVYTSPIKALSNQKFRDFKKTFGDVGLVTGDVQINSKAFCLIMTTEILRSMLYNGSDVIRDLEWVIFDEVHYINDAERGVVWEEVLIMLPDRCNVILLSATTPNTMEFANWVGKIKRKKIFVISTLKRPVPLVHHLYTGNSSKTCNEMFVILDSNKRFQMSGYRMAIKAKEDRASKHSKTFGAKQHRGGTAASEKGVWLSLLTRLRKQDQLPVVAFTLSRRRCDDNAMALTSLDLTSTHEKSEIHVFFNKCVQRLKGNDRILPQVLQMESLLKRGLGIHHSGILPILKEVVEMLFARGLVKLLFATETFAMGVNMPARSVVFDRLRKHDGTAMRNLLPGEYIQMAGRAGRRGLDANGNVIILCPGDVPEVSELHAMMLGRPSKLQSKFRLTYSMILNLLRVEQLRVEEVMKRSFSEFHNRKDSKIQEERLKELKEKMEKLSNVSDVLELSDYRGYLEGCTDLLESRTRVMKHILSQSSKHIQTGRVIILNHEKYTNHLAVILKITNDEKRGNIFKCLLTTEEDGTACEDDGKEDNRSWDPMMVLGRNIFIPTMKFKPIVIDVGADEILQISRRMLKIDPKRIISDHERREIPRFRSDPPAAETSVASQELVRMAESTIDFTTCQYHEFVMDLKKDFGINKMEAVEEIIKIRSIESSIEDNIFTCTQLPMFDKQVKEVAKYLELEKECEELRYLLSEESLHLLPEYQQRVDILKELNYIDKTGAVQLKGRVACEISNHELVLTEVVFENIFSQLQPCEIVALLSCTVFQQRVDTSMDREKDLPKSIQEGIESIRACTRKIGQQQFDMGLQQPVDEFVNLLNFGIVEVVYEWAKGTSFKDITNLTEVQEGVIVRTIQRLNETCRDVRNAARVIGDPVLYEKMEKCSEMIKRDIVFAASLYTQ